MIKVSNRLILRLRLFQVHSIQLLPLLPSSALFWSSSTSLMTFLLIFDPSSNLISNMIGNVSKQIQLLQNTEQQLLFLFEAGGLRKRLNVTLLQYLTKGSKEICMIGIEFFQTYWCWACVRISSIGICLAHNFTLAKTFMQSILYFQV